MTSRLRARFGSAHAIALLALFFAIAGGSAVALKGKNSVTSDDLKNKQVKTADLAPSAVTSPKIKNGAVGKADVKQNEAIHVLGAPGQPGFGNGGQGDCVWSTFNNFTGIPLNPAGFYKDAYGVVHLTGAVQRNPGSGGDAACDDEDNSDKIAFTLPPGYRAPEMSLFTATSGGPGDLLVIAGDTDRGAGSINIPAGTVLFAGAPGVAQVSLEGITFRATGSGGGVDHSAPASGSEGSAPTGSLGRPFK